MPRVQVRADRRCWPPLRAISSNGISLEQNAKSLTCVPMRGNSIISAQFYFRLCTV